MITVTESQTASSLTIVVSDELGTIGRVTQFNDGRFITSSIARFSQESFDSKELAIDWIVATVRNFQEILDMPHAA